VTLTAYVDPARSRVQLFARPGVTAQQVPATLTRVEPGGVRVPVRQGTGLIGDAVIDDYECPLDVPVTYELDPDGDTVTVTLPGTAGPVLVHPTDPTRNLFVAVVDDTPVEARTPGTVHRVVGRALPLVTHTTRNDVRRELVLWLPYAELPALWTLTADGSPLLVKIPAGCAVEVGWRWPERVRVVKRARDRRGTRGVDVELDAFDVDTPAGPITADPVNSWAAVREYVGTWEQVDTTYPSWLDVRLAVFPPDDVIDPPPPPPPITRPTP
jgi:hypothetical protein